MNARSKSDLTALSALEMAALTAHGEVSAAELVEAHIERIEEANPALNAVVVKCYDEARAAARRADEARMRGDAPGALHGVPVTVKECLDVAGTPSTFGLRWRANLHADRDDVHVRQLRAAGAIVLGKTNVAQCLVYYESDNPLYGRTNNPWSLDRTAGGSSGGEGAIIAARGSPLGLGTDIGGSTRIPAAFCGIASLKPTSGRTPDPGRYSVPIGQRAIASQVGVLARCTSDVATGLEIINRANVEPPLALEDYRKVDVSRLRVATYTDDGTLQVSPAVARAVRESARVLEQLGAETMELKAPPGPEAVHLYFALLSGDGGRGFKRALRGERPDARVKTLMVLAGLPGPVRRLARGLLDAMGQPTLAGFLAHFGYGSVSEYWDLVQAQMEFQQRFAAILDKERIDVVLCPPCALPAFAHGSSKDLGVAGGYGILWNLLGYPAGVVPVSCVQAGEESCRKPSSDRVERAASRVEEGSAGLPVGVQVVARPWREHVVLAAMRAIEDGARKHARFPVSPPP